MNALGYKTKAIVGKTVIRLLELPIRMSVPSRAMFDSSGYDWVGGVESALPAIQKEYLALYPDGLPDITEVSEEQGHVVEAGEGYRSFS